MKPTLVVLTGAGISAESGIKTFRDANGLWGNHAIEDVATPEAFARDPETVNRFYNARRSQLLDPSIQPNAAHLALVELEQKWPGDFLLVTQNVDHLHAQAGSKKLIQMHGELKKSRCVVCQSISSIEGDLTGREVCQKCDIAGTLRPHIVWFGETPLELEPIYEALKKANIFCAVGTSGWVFPAAGFAGAVPAHCRKFEINLESTGLSHSFNERLLGPATEQVPRWVDLILSRVQGSLLFES